MLFATEARGSLECATVSENFEEVLREFSLPRRALVRARELALGVANNSKAIDERIAAASEHWRLHRLAGVERNVLRVATYELLYEPDTPAEVVIDEAVEIARRYAGASSSAFVNGVLDAVHRDLAGPSP